MKRTYWIVFSAIILVIIVGIFLWHPSFTSLRGPTSSTTSSEAGASSTTSNASSSTSTINTASSTASTTAKLSDAELKERIGEMLLIGFRGTSINSSSYVVRVMNDLKVGGVILYDYDSPSKSFPRNITSPAQLLKLDTDLKHYSPIPLFIAVDAEGGKVNRLKPSYGFINIPSAQEMGQGSAASTRTIADSLGNELKNEGINLDFAPDVDVNVNPTNPIIGALGRSFSADPNVVTTQAAAFIGGLHDKGIISVIKHFPGHGSSTGDTHLGIVDVTNTYEQKELIPFRNLIAQGLPDIVMTAHIINRNIDPIYPATLSQKFIKNILRGQLGWNGVVVSDDMQMGAITAQFGMKDAAVRAVQAGCDILIVSNNVNVYDEQAPYKVRDALFNAVRSGKISEDSIIASSNRIRALKTKFGI